MPIHLEGNWQMIQFYRKRVTIDHHLTFPNMLSLKCWERWSCKYFGMDVAAEDDVTFFLVAHEMKGVCVCGFEPQSSSSKYCLLLGFENIQVTRFIGFLRHYVYGWVRCT